MELITATEKQLVQVMAWFPDRRSCEFWGGPQFRYPFTATTFFEDARVASVPSYALMGNNAHPLGFGQYYSRAGRCHLARLVIAPEYRRQGIGRKLISELARIGTQALAVSECSLFVMKGNEKAIRLYEKLGFVRRTAPGEAHTLDTGEYMIVQAHDIME